MSDLLAAPRLRPGDRVRLVSPGSFPDRSLVDEYLAVLDRWGLVGEVAAHALDRWGYMAGSDEHRLEDLNEAFRDPGVRAVVTTRGGAGAYRIADRIDFAAVRADPKPLVGFSDITHLHLSLLEHGNVGGIHGCLVGPTAVTTVRHLLMTTDRIVLRRDPAAVSASIRVAGAARGRIVGGNLASMATSVGVRLPSMSGAVLFLEDQRTVGLGAVDRQLTQLISSGALEGVVAVAIGSFEGFRGYVDRGWTVHDVLSERLGSLHVPVLGGLPAGHDLFARDGVHDQSALPLGSLASLDSFAGTLSVEPVVK